MKKDRTSEGLSKVIGSNGVTRYVDTESAKEILAKKAASKKTCCNVK